MNTIITMKWGTQYPAHYVNVLCHNVKKNLNIKHRFICFTDDPTGLAEGIEALPLPQVDIPTEHKGHPWQKLGAFSPAVLKAPYRIQGRCLYLDLDLMIVGNLDELFLRAGKFLIIRDYRKYFLIRNALGVFRVAVNSSVFRFTVGDQNQIWEKFQQNPLAACEGYQDEQTFAYKNAKGAEFLPQSWCVNFKRQVLPMRGIRRLVSARIPRGAKVIVFNGVPKPENMLQGEWLTKHGKVLRKAKVAPWYKKHWSLEEETEATS